MATRRKAGKAKAKRKKRTVSKTAPRKTIRKKATKKPARRLRAKKARRPASTAKPRPIRARAREAIKAPSRRPATPIAGEQRIGVVTHYYSHLSVVLIRLEPGATLRVGDVIHIWGHTTDFTQKVESLEVDRAPVAEVGPKADFGLKVIAHAREHDIVSKARS